MANKEQWVHIFFFKSGLWWARKLLQNEFSKSRLWFCEQKNTKHPSCSVFSYQYIRCPRTRAPEKKGEIFIKGQINNPSEKYFYLERYLRKEHFISTNQSVLSHPGLFPVIVGRLHIITFSINWSAMKLLRNVNVKISFKSLQIALVPPSWSTVLSRECGNEENPHALFSRAFQQRFYEWMVATLSTWSDCIYFSFHDPFWRMLYFFSCFLWWAHVH
jgi:hypothetical protein